VSVDRWTLDGVGLVGVGYEGHTIETFVDDLLDRGVTRVVDVRLNAMSRKPGFSKRGLATALAEDGIAYEHRPALGNPKENRAGYAAGHPAAHAVYAARLQESAAKEALAEIAAWAGREEVALLCLEADPTNCHRTAVLAAVPPE
jgi:uncharacterized protein (DUF488 family)